MRCDKLQVSCTHFLDRLPQVVGAGIENPQDLATLRSYLSSKPMFLVLDNAETILDPGANDAEAIYLVVDELRQFANVYILITAHIDSTSSKTERDTLPPS